MQYKNDTISEGSLSKDCDYKATTRHYMTLTPRTEKEIVPVGRDVLVASISDSERDDSISAFSFQVCLLVASAENVEKSTQLPGNCHQLQSHYGQHLW